MRKQRKGRNEGVVTLSVPGYTPIEIQLEPIQRDLETATKLSDSR